MACASVAEGAAARRPSRRGCRPLGERRRDRQRCGAHDVADIDLVGKHDTRRAPIGWPQGVSHCRQLDQATAGAHVGLLAPTRKLGQRPTAVDPLLAFGAAHVPAPVPARYVVRPRGEVAESRDRLLVDLPHLGHKLWKRIYLRADHAAQVRLEVSRSGLASCTVTLSAAPSRIQPPNGRPPGSWTLDRLGLSDLAGRMWCPCPGRVRRTPRSSVARPLA